MDSNFSVVDMLQQFRLYIVLKLSAQLIWFFVVKIWVHAKTLPCWSLNIFAWKMDLGAKALRILDKIEGIFRGGYEPALNNFM